MNNVFCVIDATNKGSFSKLTRHRMPGALPFGGKYRLIDFPLSNCKNSGITNVAIFPYGNYRSLADHIGSGDRWDLNRRKDGIFILPPKNLNLTYEDSISFQRMYEHMEYFSRSSQEYVMITPANIVWNVDFQEVLQFHTEHEADITEVLNTNGERLRTFLLSKQRLMEYIQSFDIMKYRNLTEIFDYGLGLRKNRFVYESPCFLIDHPQALYQANMSLLDFSIRQQIFQENRPIFSKETMSSPARYGKTAFVKESIVASGAVVEGIMYHSIVGRKATIEEGAIVRHSIVMNQCRIEKGAVVEYAILDKETVVKSNAVVKGTLQDLYVSEKKQLVSSAEELTVIQLAIECVPFVKTGGLADVVGALAVELSKLGLESIVMLPLFPKVKEKYQLFLELIAEQIIQYDQQNHRVSLSLYRDKQTTFYFIESYDFFDREQVYGYPDDGDRFAFFTKAAIAFFDTLPKQPDIVHVHDWHLGLTPLYLKSLKEKRNIKTLMTIHNLEYQGVHPANILEKMGIPQEVYRHHHHTINFLELGLQHTSKISTVSSTYRDELKYEYYSKNLVDLINRRDRDFYGILNGLASQEGPTTDVFIEARYDRFTVKEQKKVNKQALQKMMNLSVGDDYFIVGMVGRIVEQKGFEIIFQAMDQMMQNDRIQFVLLGTGNQHYMDVLRSFESRYPGRMKLNLGYDATEPSYIYAGADVFLMPSRYEPCGTSQMIALRYGTIPIVRQTGGLNDTVEQFDPVRKKGNGFKFYNYDSRDLLFQVQNAYQCFAFYPEDWFRLIQNAMTSDFSFSATASQYYDLYHMMM